MDLIKRYKIVALLILESDDYECLRDKLDTVASSIDRGSAVAPKMVEFLEDAVLKISDKLTTECLICKN